MLHQSQMVDGASSRDTKILQIVLQRWCGDRNLSLSDGLTGQAEVELKDLYEMGIRDPDDLFDLICTI